MEWNNDLKLYSMLMILSCNNGILTQHIGISREFCMETFQPSCAKKEVIVIQKALYGRIKIGQCMKNDFGLPSCYADELHHLAGLCSGKRSCELVIPSPELAAKQDCLADLSSYLEVSYVCQNVYVPRNERCISPERITVSKKNNYIASITSVETSCGLHKSPWILEAQPGQHINITLMDFALDEHRLITSHNQHPCVRSYGYILDMESDDVIHICGGEQRHKHVYTSVGHRIQIIFEPGILKQNSFIVKYNAEGCPKYKLPKYSWVQRENESLVIRCEHGNSTWKLRCVDDIWLGIVGNCSPPPAVKKIESIPEVRIEKTRSKQQNSSKLPPVSDNHVITFAMGCATLITCCTIAFLGIYCTKRYEAHVLGRISKNTMPYQNNGTIKTGMTYRPVTTTGLRAATLLTNGSELPPYTFVLPKEERQPIIPQRTSTYNSDNIMMRSTAESDYLAPQGADQKLVDGGEDDTNSVQYWILENPAETLGNNMSDEMYQSIHLNNSLSSNKA